MVKRILFTLCILALCSPLFAAGRTTLQNGQSNEITSTQSGSQLMLDVSADISNSGTEEIGKVRITSGDNDLTITSVNTAGVTSYTSSGDEATGINPIANTISVGMATDHYDTQTRAINTVDYAHHEIHSGSHFFVDDFAVLSADTTLSFCFQTPAANDQVHLIWDFQNTNETIFQVYEGITGSGGTLVTVFNNNRNSGNASGTTITSNCTVTNYGTRLLGEITGFASTPSKSFGSGTGRDNELVLAENTKYLFAFWSQGNDNNLSFRGEWYEHTPKSNS